MSTAKRALLLMFPCRNKVPVIMDLEFWNT